MFYSNFSTNPSIISNFDSTIIGDILAQRQLAIELHPGKLKTPILLLHALAARGKVALRLGAPPVFHVPIGAHVPALIVETVRDFVADDHANCAVVEA